MGALGIASVAVSYGSWVQGSADRVPLPPREFRAVWVTTVYNLDWPSRAGLSAGQQQAELVAILDRARALKLNAVVLQVRPMGDALYASRVEPWSSFLTGSMGKSPGYDPLAFAVQEAHRRGLELHAWFNPYRAKVSSVKQVHSSHLMKSHPWVVRPAGSSHWFDPSSTIVRERAITVIMDVVKRYDIDGVHLDDYFYPYPNAGGGPNFDDRENYAAFRSKGGSLNRDDWRRAQVDRFVETLYGNVKGGKPWVLVGISPFGIWRPGVPTGIEAGLDAYGQLYADSRGWLRRGWVDYLSPQLYWRIGGPQDFRKLNAWWQSESTQGRHVWPGIASSRIGRGGEGDGRSASEILRQISETRSTGGQWGPGHIHWRYEALRRDRGGIADQLRKGPYAGAALTPASPWLAKRSNSGTRPLPGLKLEAGAAQGGVRFEWRSSGASERGVRWWAVQIRRGSQWTLLDRVPDDVHGLTLSSDFMKGVNGFAVRSVDRYGGLGPVAVLEYRS